MHLRSPPKPWRETVVASLEHAGRDKVGDPWPFVASPAASLLAFDQLAVRTLPAGWTAELLWPIVKVSRVGSAVILPLEGQGGSKLTVRAPAPILSLLHEIDVLGGMWLDLPSDIQSEGPRYIVSSLIEEAIASSQIEGVATTRPVAKEMIRSGRSPRNEDERQILNNFRAMELVRRHVKDPLTPELLLELHHVVTEGTLKDPSDCGRLRSHDQVVVEDPRTGEVLHTPPPAVELQERVSALCALANGAGPEHLHPSIRATALHFAIGYIHPFVDGNGRVARALFHRAMLRAGFRLYEYVAVSKVILSKTGQYRDVFLRTEGDDLDLTYFLEFHLRCTAQALRDAHANLQRRHEDRVELASVLKGLMDLNTRSRALLERALDRPDTAFTFRSHGRAHDIAWVTARSDILELEAAGLLVRSKRGREFVFRAAPDLRKRLTRSARKRG